MSATKDDQQLQSYFDSLEKEKRIVPGQELSPHLITFMDLSRSQLTDSGLRFICSLKHVKHLNLSQCASVTNNGLVHLSGLPLLTSLDLSKCRLLTNNIGPSLLPLSNLKKLNLSSLNIEDSISEFFPLNLVELDVSRTAVSGDLITALASRNISVSLRVLTMAYTNVTSYQSLVQLSCFPALNRIDLDGTEVVFNGSLAKLKVRGGQVAQITRGVVIEINDSAGKQMPSWYPTAKEKNTWYSTVYSYFSPYLSQSTSWAHVNTPPKPKRLQPQSPQQATKRALFPSNNVTNVGGQDPKRRKLVFDKENTSMKLDRMFPHEQEVLQSLRSGYHHSGEDNLKFLLSPAKSPSSTKAHVLGDNSPLPNALAELLKLPKTSPSVSRTKSRIPKNKI